MERIKSFEALDQHISEKKFRDKIGDRYDEFLKYKSLDIKSKQKYLKDRGINFFETSGLYDPITKTVLMSYINPFTNKHLKFTVKNVYDSKKAVMVKGHISINYNANDPTKVFGFIPSHHKDHFERGISGVPTQSRAAYEKEKQKVIAENKAKSEANRLKNAAREQHMIEHLNELKSYERIYFDDFVTVHNVNHCLNSGHNVEQIQALILILRSSGKIMPKVISAGYCHECNYYFIEHWQMEHLREYGVPLCQFISETIYYKSSGDDYFDNLEPESVLHRSGYNVCAQEGLSSVQRQKILALLLESGICNRHKITSHLTWLIDSRCGNPYMENAISKWREDRKFASNYKLDQDRLVGVQLIRNRVRRKLN